MGFPATGEKPRIAVLIVEDEALQRVSLVDMVEDAGYAPVEAVDADHALSILERRTDIRIILADVNLPSSMDGLRLVNVIRNRWPPIEVIIMTAGCRPAAAAIPARTEFMSKPLSEGQVKTVLDRFAA